MPTSLQKWGIKINLTNDVNLEEYDLIRIYEPVEIISPNHSIIKGASHTYFIIHKEASLYTENIKFNDFDLVFENHNFLNCNNTDFNMNELVLKNIKGSFNFVNCNFKGKYGSINTEGQSTSYLVNCTSKNGQD